MGKTIFLPFLFMSTAIGLAAAPGYVTVLLPNPSNYRFSHVAGLNSHDVVLTESPADNYPFAYCENLETRFCATAVWSERSGYRAIPLQQYSDYRLNDRGEVAASAARGSGACSCGRRSRTLIGSIEAIWCACGSGGFNDAGRSLDRLPRATRGFFTSKRPGRSTSRTWGRRADCHQRRGQWGARQAPGYSTGARRGFVNISAEIPTAASVPEINDHGQCSGR
jgi:hypothetical protein